MPVLSDLEIYAYAHAAFGDIGRDATVIFGAICLAESGGDPAAEFDNVAHGYQPVGSPYQWDRGLPQINSIHGFDPQRLLSDPAYACSAGRAVYNLQGFPAWTTFKGGQFRQFVPRMEAAADVFHAAVVAPAPVLPPPFSRDDAVQVYFHVYGYAPRILIEPDGFEGDGRRRYHLIMP